MISASHNPPGDNGFKAYWSHGGQVLPPHDEGIIACVDAADVIPQVDYDAAVAAGQIRELGPDPDDQYLRAVTQLSLTTCRDVRAVYTPLHGVGETSVWPVLQRAGFYGCELFELQRTPDGRFPHVPQHLPNPERSAVFDPAIAACKDRDIDLILASDPDADRLAVAVRQRGGSFVCLTGNQHGALLTDFVLRQRQQQGRLSPRDYVLETLVTTPLTAAVAVSYGVRVIRDLPVGFKHMAAVVEREGAEHFVIGTEESIGFLAGDYCRDKDAAVAALWTLELAADLKSREQTPLDRLDELYARYGMHRESQVSREFPGPSGAAQITAIVRQFRDQPPKSFGSVRWRTLHDYRQGEVRELPDNKVVAAVHVPHTGELLILHGQDDSCTVQLAVRPSGTEPKIKFYLFVQAPPESPLSDAKAWTDTTLHRLQAELESWIRSQQTTLPSG
jgi:phosphoglucomutase/phosphomannomutase